MAQPDSRAIRPADILEFLRQNGDQGFKQRNYRADGGVSVFERRSAVDDAIPLEAEDGIAPVTEHLPTGIPEAEVEHRLAAARAAAKAEGMAEERARLMGEIEAERAQLNEALSAFERVTARLSEVHPDDSASLVGALEEAIRRLASERAGIEIDETPTAFLRRIETLADRVGQGIRSVRIRLNPGDFAAIQQFIESSETIEEGMIAVDLSLGRGDVIVRSDAVRLEDVIAPAKLDAKPARKPRLKSTPKDDE